MRAHKHEDDSMSSNKNGSILQDHENRITRLEVVIENIAQTLSRLEGKIDGLDSDMKQGFKDINNRLWTNFFWMVGGFAGVLGIVAHAMKWI